MNYKNIILIPLLIVIVVALSGCITDVGGIEYEHNGIKFNYPEDWQEARSIAEGSMGAVSYSNNSEISIVIQQVPSEYGSSIDEAYATNNKNLQLAQGYINIQENTTTIKNKNLKLHRYILNDAQGNQKEHIASWVKMSDGKFYVILYSAPVEYYEQEKESYDLVVSTFALENEVGSSVGDQLTSKLSDILGMI